MSNQSHDNAADIQERPHRSLLERAKNGARGGSNNFTNLSLYTFGISGVWTGIGAGILPFKVLEALELGDVTVIGYSLDKNGALGMLSLMGLVVAAAAQLGSGALSDRDPRIGRRLPFLLIGAVGLAGLTVLFGFTASFVSLLLAMVAMQLFGNFAQGPANALIIDHVSVHKRGEAAGVLNLWRLLGAGSITVIVLQFMARYDNQDAPQWLWYSIGLMVIVLLIGVVWTVVTVRPKTGLFIPTLKRPKRTKSATAEPSSSKISKPKISRNYLAFLVALAFALASMSSMQIYALFFLQDVVGLENPADGADLLVVVIAATAGLTVFPAGYFSDKYGKTNLFVIAGISGVTSSLLLLLVSSIGPVLVVGVIVGITVGLYMTLTWAVANDLVSRSSAAWELGYTSIATLAGATAARFAGIGIDELNNVSPNLGYKAILVSAAVGFALSSIILARLVRDSETFTAGTTTESAPARSAPD
jgi:MFS family permease